MTARKRASGRASWDANYWRLLEAAEAMAKAAGTAPRLPPCYAQALAAATGYAPGSVKATLSFIRGGRIGPEAAARAKLLRTTPRQTINYDLVETLMDKGLPASVIHARVNVVRQQRGIDPAKPAVIRVTMSQIRARRRKQAEAAL